MPVNAKYIYTVLGLTNHLKDQYFTYLTHLIKNVELYISRLHLMSNQLDTYK